MSDETPDIPNEPTPDPTKRRPKDSEFFELPPDLKKLPPGGLPATASSGTPKSKGDEKPAGGAKKGCGGMILFAVGTAAAAAGALFATLL